MSVIFQILPFPRSTYADDKSKRPSNTSSHKVYLRMLLSRTLRSFVGSERRKHDERTHVLYRVFRIPLSLPINTNVELVLSWENITMYIYIYTNGNNNNSDNIMITNRLIDPMPANRPTCVHAVSALV